MKRTLLLTAAGLAAGFVAPFLCLFLSSAFHIGTGEFPLCWIWPTCISMMLAPSAAEPEWQIMGVAIAINMAIYAVGFVVGDALIRLLRRAAKRFS